MVELSFFDSSKQIFARLMKAKDEQKSGNGSYHAGYFPRLKHMTGQAFAQLFGLSINGSSERIYLKPELFGIRELKQFIQHAKSYFDRVSRRYVCQLPEVKEQLDCSAEEAFRENTDKKLLNNWKDIISALPLVSEMREESVRNATRYGIGETYRQTNAIGATYPNKEIGEFRRSMVEQYGEDDISVRKGREIIFTSEGLADSPLTCEFLSQMQKFVSSVN